MEFNFEELYNLTLQQYKSTKEKCFICHKPIEEKELVLTCKHEYHHQCFNTMKDKKKCPYCEKRANIQNNGTNNCQYTLKTNGLICGRTNCKYHKKKESSVIPNNNNMCTSILKSGPKKGQECGRSNCKYHHINL
jgi:hypothetical protein